MTEPAAPVYATNAGPRNGLGTAGLVLGILAVLLCWTVVGGVLLGILAIVFGAVGRNRAKRAEATNGGAALAGIILGAAGLILAIVLIAVGATFYNHHKQDFKNLNACLQQANSQQERTNCNNQFNNAVTH
jgi:Na+/melibiose symporter-like transporter